MWDHMTFSVDTHKVSRWIEEDARRAVEAYLETHDSYDDDKAQDEEDILEAVEMASDPVDREAALNIIAAYNAFEALRGCEWEDSPLHAYQDDVLQRACEILEAK